MLLGAYSARSLESARRAEDDLFGYQNSRKARMGMLAGLQDPAIMAAKRATEESLRNAVTKSSALTEKYGGAWDEVARAVEEYRAMYRDVYLIERSVAFNSVLYRKARDLVRLAAEKRKPNAERLPEYAEAGLESLFQELYSEAPVYDDLEVVMLGDSLSMMAELMGMEHPFVQQVLAGRSPQARAADLVRGTKLKDVSERKRLAGGGLAAVESSSDSMIQFARLVDPEARRIRAAYEEKVDEPLRRAYARIAGARFAVYGAEVYPDATFTLRLAFGQAVGYTSDGQRIPWATRMGGIYARAADQKYREPFNLPKSWLDARSRLNPATPFNFVSTADIIGGNSGSPVVNREGEVVGLIFDGNIQSLVLNYVYSDEQARAVSVHSAAILEALRKIYGNEALVRELTGGGR